MIKVKNEPIINHIFEHEVILYPMNIYSSTRNGFRHEIEVNFHKVSEEERKTPYGDRRKYGTIFSSEESGVTFVACYMYKTNYKKDGVDTVDYESLKKCLSDVAFLFKGKNIATTVLGATEWDGNGNSRQIRDIIKSKLGDLNVTLYDFKQEDYALVKFREIAKLHKERKEGKISKEEYRKKREQIQWERKNGIYNKRYGNSKD